MLVNQLAILGYFSLAINSLFICIYPVYSRFYIVTHILLIEIYTNCQNGDAKRVVFYHWSILSTHGLVHITQSSYIVIKIYADTSPLKYFCLINI